MMINLATSWKKKRCWHQSAKCVCVAIEECETCKVSKKESGFCESTCTFRFMTTFTYEEWKVAKRVMGVVRKKLQCNYIW